VNLLKIFNPKSERFFDWYKSLADNNVKAAEKLQFACNNIKEIEKVVLEVSKLEHESDGICLKIFDELNRIFITPMDREDITDLTRSLDDVMDFIHLSVNTISVYNIKKMNKVSIQFSEIILDSTKVISKSLPKLNNRKTFPSINKAVSELNSLETKADELLKEGLRDLFKKPTNAVDVIRWRDIYNMMEEITDKTEDIADVLHDLIIKYA
jgi:predicted phosphate transport protein (TIGR00153 family)